MVTLPLVLVKTVKSEYNICHVENSMYMMCTCRNVLYVANMLKMLNMNICNIEKWE